MGFESDGWPASIIIRGMVIEMNDKQLATLAQVKTFLAGTTALDFTVAPMERCDFISRTLQRSDTCPFDQDIHHTSIKSQAQA